MYTDVREKTPLELGESFLELTCGEAEEKRMEFLKNFWRKEAWTHEALFLEISAWVHMRAKIRLIFQSFREDCF